MKQYKKELDKAKVESNFVKKKANNVFFCCFGFFMNFVY